MARTQTSRRSMASARRGGYGRQPVRGGRWSRSQPAQRQGGGTAKKGMLMAVAPMVGGLVMKKMRSRQQAKKDVTVS